MAWGATAAQERARRAAGSGNVFIRSFDTTETKIRFLWDDPENAFITTDEHFDRAAKLSYPCAKKAGYERCIGCEFPLPDNHDESQCLKADGKRKPEGCGCAGCQVRKRTQIWLFPALNDEGYLNVYKVGYKLWQNIIGKFNLFGTIADRDYAIMHTIDPGKSGPSAHSYDAVRLDDDHPRSPKTGIPNFGPLLMDKYLHALTKYSFTPEQWGVNPADAAVPAADSLPEHTNDPSIEPANGDSGGDDGGDPAPEAVADPGPGIVTAEALAMALASHGVTVPASLGVETLTKLLEPFVDAAAAAPPAAAQPAAAPEPAAAGNGQPPQPPTTTAVANGNGNGGGGRDFTTWTTQDVRDFLTEKKVVFSPTAPRSQLLKAAETAEGAVQG